jgi:hypothetical protein
MISEISKLFLFVFILRSKWQECASYLPTPTALCIFSRSQKCRTTKCQKNWHGRLYIYDPIITASRVFYDGAHRRLGKLVMSTFCCRQFKFRYFVFRHFGLRQKSSTHTYIYGYVRLYAVPGRELSAASFQRRFQENETNVGSFQLEFNAGSFATGILSTAKWTRQNRKVIHVFSPLWRLLWKVILKCWLCHTHT